jgi:L-fuculose-phosphate aldolase
VSVTGPGSAAADVVAVAQALDEAGLMPNKSGNVSVRTGRGCLITPAAVPYRELVPASLVEVDGNTLDFSDGKPGVSPISGKPGVSPSSEWRMHVAIYDAYPQTGAVVHTHSPHATALACAGLGIPPFHYMIALAGGDVRCMPYATFGTAELAAAAVRGLEGRRATLLSNHGVIATGPTLRVAHAVALEVENLARQWLALRAAGLQPQLLDEAELARVLDKFADYGRLD